MDRQVDVIGHKGKSEYAMPEPFARFLENLVEAIPVLVVRENVLTGIAALDDVVNRSGAVYAGFSRHGLRLSGKFNSSRPDPLCPPLTPYALPSLTSEFTCRAEKCEVERFFRSGRVSDLSGSGRVRP
jgi:hypothetical protein